MRGYERVDRHLLDAAALARHLVAHRAQVFPMPITRTCSPRPALARPSIPGHADAAVVTLQALKRLLEPGDR
jgi:hypothetical protein